MRLHNSELSFHRNLHDGFNLVCKTAEQVFLINLDRLKQKGQVVMLTKEELLDLSDNDNQQDKEITVSFCKFSCHFKYLMFVCSTPLEETNKVTLEVVSMATNSVISRQHICSIMQGNEQAGVEVTGIQAHPMVDELMLIYGERGRIMLLDVITNAILWVSLEFATVRKVPLRTISVDTCRFTPDGNKIIAITVLGTISLYCADGLVGASRYAPVEQYMRFEFENPELIFIDQQFTNESSRICSMDGAIYPFLKPLSSEDDNRSVYSRYASFFGRNSPCTTPATAHARFVQQLTQCEDFCDKE